MTLPRGAMISLAVLSLIAASVSSCGGQPGGESTAPDSGPSFDGGSGDGGASGIDAAVVVDATVPVDGAGSDGSAAVDGAPLADSPVDLESSSPAGADAAACNGVFDGQACGSNTSFICCGESCVDPWANDENCGGCGVACPAGTFCSGQNGSAQPCTPIPSCGSVEGDTALCPLGPNLNGMCCNGACDDVKSDVKNCGGCGHACAVGESCSGGSCSHGTGPCPPGYFSSNGECLLETCSAGDDGDRCAFGPYAVGKRCAGKCIDPSQDPAHCGSTCGNDCSWLAGSLCGDMNNGGSLSVCVSSSGGSNFPTSCSSFGQKQCETPNGGVGACCQVGIGGSACTDLVSDPHNCGGCNFACDPGQTCSGGVCSGTKAPCGAGTVGEYCNLAAGTSFLCCSGTGCIDVNTSALHCGWCGNACPSGFGCAAGTCVAASCAATTQGQSCLLGGTSNKIGACCGSVCVNTATSASDCGSCGVACPGSETCLASACGVSACTAATTGDPCHLPGGGGGLCCASGCIDKTSDPLNCGGCGLSCPAGKTCVSSHCG